MPCVLWEAEGIFTYKNRLDDGIAENFLTFDGHGDK